MAYDDSKADPEIGTGIKTEVPVYEMRCPNCNCLIRNGELVKEEKPG